jgi:DNA modification methylase
MTPKLYNSDFFTNWEPIGPGSIDLILTDPPYGLFGCESKLGLDWDTLPNLGEMESIFDKLLKPDGQLILFSDLNLLIKLLAGFSNKFQFRFYFIWVKSGGMPISKRRPINNTEFILVFRKKGSRERDLTWHPYEMGEKGKPYIKRNSSPDIPTRRKKKSPVNTNNDGWRYPKATLYFPSRPNMTKAERSVTTHPCQKPEAMLRTLIKGFSNPGDKVLDPFAGSGSTLVSAFKEGRNSIGYEIEKKYYQEASKRIKELTAQEILL